MGITILKREILSHEKGVLEKVTFRRQRFDGKVQEVTREVYDSGDAATILPYDPERGRVLLVRQFRLPVYLATGRETTIEACAGKLDGMDAAKRILEEAQEEMGFTIKEPKFLFTAFMSPGSYKEKISFFVARYNAADRTGAGGGLFDEGEDTEAIELTLDEALAMIEKGEIIDAKTIVLLQYAKLSGLLQG
ncbi:MAG TPA: NUDIX domain-containing protein [Methylovirgula sp.]|nr:NUDIX domain-containing protein [Methylovirgula sp.]